MVTPAHCHNYFKKSPFFLPGLPRCTLRRAFRAGKDAYFCAEPPRSTLRAGFGLFSCPAGGCNRENTFVQQKKRLPHSQKTLKCGRIYKPSSVLQTGARRHPKKLLSFICCSLPPSNGRATLDCWYTWPCRLQ